MSAQPIESSLSSDVGASRALAGKLDGIVHILTCGSVDDGKSTLIGRLLWDTAALPDDQRDMLRHAALKSGRPDILDYSLLLDGLVAEREQGITIDIAWRYVDTVKRRLVIIDSPGHEQYTRNMVSGASHADVAVMLIDARHGIKRQTRRHAAILNLMGLRHVVLAVNKMDLVDWSERRFRAIESDFRSVVANLGLYEAVAIPVSARLGDNVTSRSNAMAWYHGPTLVGHLERMPSQRTAADGVFRMPVQTVLRDGQGFRALAGSITSGKVRVGDRVVDVTTGRAADVARIATMDGDLEQALAGMAISIVLATDLDIARGAVLAAPDAASISAHRIEARLIWLAEAALVPSQSLLLRTATDIVPIAAIEVGLRLDLQTLAFRSDAMCQTNDIVTASITLARAAALDRFEDSAATGVFLLVDPFSGDTLAGGIAVEIEAAEQCDVQQRPVFRLTKAMLAAGLCSDLGSSTTDDRELRRRAREVERLLAVAGIAVELDLANSERASFDPLPPAVFGGQVD